MIYGLKFGTLEVKRQPPIKVTVKHNGENNIFSIISVGYGEIWRKKIFILAQIYTKINLNGLDI